MNKKILIGILCAIVVVVGCGAGVAIMRNRNTQPVDGGTTTAVNSSIDDNYDYNMDDYTYENNEVQGEDTISAEATTDSQGIIANLFNKTTKAVETTKKVANAVKTTAKATTKAASTKATTKAASPSSGGGFVEDAIGDDAQQSFLGYRYSSDGYYYCDDKDCWQKDAGYNEVYDKWAPVAAMYIDQVRIRFQYGGKNWMVQFWKGQYGYLLIGAEIGLYTCGLDDYKGGTGDINHFNCADKSDWLKMQLDAYYCKGGNGTYKKIFTRPYGTYWWATGFVKGQVTKYTKPRTELKTKNRITFKDADQANLFVQGLKNAGFVRAASADKLVNDSYFMNGKDVWVLWYSINHDSFVGYDKNATTAKATAATIAPTSATTTTTTTTQAPVSDPTAAGTTAPAAAQ